MDPTQEAAEEMIDRAWLESNTKRIKELEHEVAQLKRVLNEVGVTAEVTDEGVRWKKK